MIIRSAPIRDYTTLHNSLINDDRLSFEAKGVAAYLLSKPADWIIRRADLMKMGRCGKDKVTRIISELKQTGYIKTESRQGQDGKLLGNVYVMYDVSQTQEQGPPMSGVTGRRFYRTPVKPDAGFPGHLLNTELIPNTDLLLNTDKKKNTLSDFASDALPEKQNDKKKPTEKRGTLPRDPEIFAEKDQRTQPEIAETVLFILNHRTGKRYPVRTPKGGLTSNAKKIVDLCRQGYDLVDLCGVVRTKCGQWGNDDKMSQYLTPATLFRRSNFEKYLGEVQRR